MLIISFSFAEIICAAPWIAQYIQLLFYLNLSRQCLPQGKYLNFPAFTHCSNGKILSTQSMLLKQVTLSS